MKKIVITGGTKGLGRALVEYFVSAGHAVCACGRNLRELNELSNKYRQPHSFTKVDVRDDAAVRRWADHSLQGGFVPDYLINNAALIARNAPLWQLAAGDVDPVIDVNIKGTIHVIRHFVPAMVRAGRGVVVNLSSGWGRSTSPEVAVYCATKYAVEGLTAALAQELPPGLAAVALNPGIIDTSMLRSCMGESAALYEKPEEWVKSAGPFILSLSEKDNGKSLTVPSSRRRS